MLPVPLAISKITVILATGALLVSGAAGLQKKPIEPIKAHGLLNYLGKEAGKAIGKETKKGWNKKAGQKTLDGRKPWKGDKTK